MRAINLYTLTRDVKDELKPIYEKSLSQRDQEIKVRNEELEQIKTIITNLIYFKAEKECLDNWFYSFTIPQIGKEFDLLKIGTNDIIVNVELKCQEVSLEKIERQLEQNQYYLSHLSKTIYSFTYMSCKDGEGKLFVFDKELKECSFLELISRINDIVKPLQKNIEKLFRPKDYLISPLNTPEKFISGKYYLNGQQEDIKKKILNEIGNIQNLWGIRGSAGTGKTLLLYDIVKALSEDYKICVVHCGMLSEGHQYLNKHLDNVTVIDAKSLSEEGLLGYEIICVDETQRLYTSGLDIILAAYENRELIGCIFSYDYAQALSKTEIRRNNPKRLNEIEGYQEQKLTERIRTNKELYSFIRNMMRLNDRPNIPMEYKNVDILYANSIKDADELSRIYREKGYTFITLTPSHYVSNTIDHYSTFINSHKVIGQEFDDVIMVLDNNFRYNEKGELEGREHPNPDYLFPRLFYQNISRAREKLCIIVIRNEAFFERLLCLKENRL